MLNETHEIDYRGFGFKQAWTWPELVQKFFQRNIVSPSLHVFCGSSKLGDIRVDIKTKCDVRASALGLPFQDCIFKTVFGDPPWRFPHHLRHFILYEMRRVCRIGGMILLNANWFPNHMKGCKLIEPLIVSRPRMPFANCSFIFAYKKFANVDSTGRLIYEEESLLKYV